MESIIVACITSGATLIGVIVTQAVAYSKQKRERLEGINESRAIEARKEQALNDRLDRIDEKLDLHNAKLDRHNGFEGRIIALETIAEHIVER